MLPSRSSGAKVLLLSDIPKLSPGKLTYRAVFRLHKDGFPPRLAELFPKKRADYP